MANKKYEVAPEGVEWASGQAGMPLEAGAEVELELEAEQETALVAAGWLIPEETPTPSKRKGG